MTTREDDEVALKLVHTADWHLGMRFPAFPEEDARRLTRARLSVIERVLGAAERNRADAVLCAGDLFDGPNPSAEWWEPLAQLLARSDRCGRVLLLPGNHDPLTPSSVWAPGHPFRAALPDWVQVVDRDDFECEIGDDAVVYAAPCRSQAGQRDLALSLPAREPGDERIRIGMVHGSTFDIRDHQTNFPIAEDAAERRGLDYLAIGDTHGFRVLPSEDAAIKTVYPSAPEPTGFTERDPGNVAVVFVARSRRVILRKERVAQWTWAERRVRDVAELRSMRDGEDLSRHVIRLRVEMCVPAAVYDEVERILTELEGTDATHGRVGILQVDRSGLSLDTRDVEESFDDLPEVLQAAARRLSAAADGPESEKAQRALCHLYRLARESR